MTTRKNTPKWKKARRVTALYNLERRIAKGMPQEKLSNAYAEIDVLKARIAATTQ